jgi:Tfp pilus assembly protein FimV
MKQTLTILCAMTLAGSIALADTRLSTLRSQAQQLQNDSMEMRNMLRQKAVDTNALQSKLSATREGVESIRALVEQIEKERPAWMASDMQAWEDVKLRAELIQVIHNTKHDLTASGDVARNRKLIMAHANGVAERATRLNERLAQLERKAGSNN